MYSSTMALKPFRSVAQSNALIALFLLFIHQPCVVDGNFKVVFICAFGRVLHLLLLTVVDTWVGIHTE